MRMMAGLAALALCVSAATAETAPAPDSRAQAARYLEDGAAVHAALGYGADRNNRDAVLALRLDSARIVPVTLRAGRNYRIYGACDADCSDMDLEIYDTNGDLADQDIAEDDTPYVQLTPARGGRYLVRVWLAQCENEPCALGVRVMSGGRLADRPAPAVAEGEGGAYVAHVTSLLDQAGAGFATEGFDVIANGGDGAVEPLQVQGGGLERAYRLRAGVTYRFVAACDQDCEDIDIAISDSEGAELASNMEADNPTSVDVTPGRSGPHKVRVWLAQCANEPCYAGVRGFERLP